MKRNFLKTIIFLAILAASIAISPSALADTCIDSDGGISYFTKGYVDTKSTNSTGHYSDLCWDGKSELREWSCNGVNVTETVYICPNGCSDGACIPAPADWDVSINFEHASPGSFYPFSQNVGQEGQIYQTKLNKTDDLYEEFIGREACNSGYWGDIFDRENARRAKGWYAERKKISETEYRILIRGIALADCGYSGSGYAQGEFSINPAGSWSIKEVIKCNVGSSNKGQETYCTSDGLSTKFAAGNACGGCCACSDSGSVDIELILERSRIAGAPAASPIIKNPVPESPAPEEPVIDNPIIERPIPDFDIRTPAPIKPDIKNKNDAKIDDKIASDTTTNNAIVLMFFAIVILGCGLALVAAKRARIADKVPETKICLKCGKVTDISAAKCPACGSENFSMRR